jgi:hypothetical protein
MPRACRSLSRTFAETWAGYSIAHLGSDPVHQGSTKPEGQANPPNTQTLYVIGTGMNLVLSQPRVSFRPYRSRNEQQIADKGGPDYEYQYFHGLGTRPHEQERGPKMLSFCAGVSLGAQPLSSPSRTIRVGGQHRHSCSGRAWASIRAHSP